MYKVPYFYYAASENSAFSVMELFSAILYNTTIYNKLLLIRLAVRLRRSYEKDI